MAGDFQALVVVGIHAAATPDDVDPIGRVAQGERLAVLSRPS